ncbi:NAD(P)-binding protein, partial [Polychaeton citri CBS 116435]
ATGALGPAIASALSTAGYRVQILSRHTSMARPLLPNNVRIAPIDYTSRTDLENVLRGQDAVISTLGDTAGAYAAQRALIEASFTAGVKRFMPSEFGSDTTNPRVRAMPFFREKIKQQEMLQALASAAHDFSWSILVTGPFLDWGLSVVPFIVNVGTRSAQLFDGGNVPFSTTRVSTVAKAVVRTLRRFDETANKTLFVHDGVTTQNAIISLEKPIMRNTGFNGVHVNNAALEATAWQDYQTPGVDPMSWVFSFINLSLWSWDGNRGICEHTQTDNGLLGLDDL